MGVVHLKLRKEEEQSIIIIMAALVTQTDKAVLERYLSLPQGERVCATYVWIDGTGEGMRSKVKCLDSKPSKVEDLPVWNYDGSSCYRADGSNSDVYLRPVKMYPDPFTRGENLLVLCETYNYKDEVMQTNHRKVCLEIMEKAMDIWRIGDHPAIVIHTSSLASLSRPRAWRNLPGLPRRNKFYNFACIYLSRN